MEIDLDPADLFVYPAARQRSDAPSDTGDRLMSIGLPEAILTLSVARASLGAGERSSNTALPGCG